MEGGVRREGTWVCCAALSHSVTSDSLCPRGLQPARLLCPWGFSRQEYRNGLPCPPQGIFPTQGSSQPTLQADSLPAELPGKPRIYIYLLLIHVDIWQKPTQYCKAITLQLKINKFLKNKFGEKICASLHVFHPYQNHMYTVLRAVSQS